MTQTKRVVSNGLLVLGLIATTLLLTGSSCKKKVNVQGPRPGELPTVRIDPPGPVKRTPAKVDPKALPDQAHAQFPAYDGDAFYVTLPVRQQADVSAQEALDKVVSPILKAMGFERGTKGVRMAPAEGVKQPVANFKGLAQQVAYEYANNRQLLRPKTQNMIDVFSGKRQADDQINGALKMGEGMDFAQFVAGIERLAIHYPFEQVDGNVPIEHTHLLASRWQGQAITSVAGVLFNQYAIANNRNLNPD